MAFNVIERIQIKNRIIGLLIRDARVTAGRSPEACAALLHIDVQSYLEWEAGQQAPTLPQMEVLAFYFDVPLAHFFNAQETLAKQNDDEELSRRVPELMMLRQRIIGVRLRQLREEAGLSVAQVADRTGLQQHQVLAVEQGQAALPVNELELLTYAVRGDMEDLVDSHGTIGGWIHSQTEFEQFTKMPENLRAFVLRPINQSYIELAMRLSSMHVDSLRRIAESILEITF